MVRVKSKLSPTWEVWKCLGWLVDMMGPISSAISLIINTITSCKYLHSSVATPSHPALTFPRTLHPGLLLLRIKWLKHVLGMGCYCPGLVRVNHFNRMSIVKWSYFAIFGHPGHGSHKGQGSIRNFAARLRDLGLCTPRARVINLLTDFPW